MKVLMFPGNSTAQNNKYIDILVAELRQNNIVVEDWNKYRVLQTSDVFHVHWPELLIWLRNRRFRWLEGNFFIWNFFDTIRRVRRGGGVVVWTVHNLEPHNHFERESALYEKVMGRFLGVVDGFFLLTEAGMEEVLQAYPPLRNLPWAKTQHPSYNAVLRPCPLDVQGRTKFNIDESAWVCSLLGNLRPNKKAELAVDAFSNLTTENFHLILAGDATDSYRSIINNRIGLSDKISVDYGVLTDEEILEYYSVSDVLVFPSQDYFNSGTIYTALSLNIPVIACRTKTNEEIQGHVGKKWLYLFDGEFNRNVVEEASNLLVSRVGDPCCDMRFFSPVRAASAIVNGYRKVLAGSVSRPRND